MRFPVSCLGRLAAPVGRRRPFPDNHSFSRRRFEDSGAGRIHRYRLFALAIALAVLRLQTSHAASPSSAPDSRIEYSTQLTPVYSDVSLTHRIGTLSPGSELHLLNGTDSTGSRAFFVNGWIQQGNATSLFLGKGERVVVAAFSSVPTSDATLSESKDDYGNVWTRVRLRAYLNPATLTDDQGTIWQRAAKLYQTRCSACHAVHKPTEFTANQWPGILKIMAKNAALQPADLALITEYLQTHAKHQGE